MDKSDGILLLITGFVLSMLATGWFLKSDISTWVFKEESDSQLRESQIELLEHLLNTQDSKREAELNNLLDNYCDEINPAGKDPEGIVNVSSSSRLIFSVSGKVWLCESMMEKGVAVKR